MAIVVTSQRPGPYTSLPGLVLPAASLHRVAASRIGTDELKRLVGPAAAGADLGRNELHLVACGGASGLVRLVALDPAKLLLRKQAGAAML